MSTDGLNGKINRIMLYQFGNPFTPRVIITQHFIRTKVTGDLLLLGMACDDDGASSHRFYHYERAKPDRACPDDQGGLMMAETNPL